MTIKLNYHKAKPVDLKEYYNKYTDTDRRTYRLLQGTPLIVNVEGTYIYVNDIPNILIDRRNIKDVDKWFSELRNPMNKGGIVLNFVWRK